MSILPTDGGLGGLPQPWDRPGLLKPRPRGGGLFGSAPKPPMVPTMTEQPLAPKKGFDWGKLIGVLGDSLSIAGGGQAQFVPNMIDQRNRQQAQQYAEQTYQRRRGDEQQDWQARQEWENANRPAPQPTEFERLVAASGLDPEQQTEMIRKYVSNRANPIDWVRADNGDGTFQLVPMGPNGPMTQGVGPQAAPQRPKGKLTPYNGGQTATPSGNFRP